jgi:hypothetical protein
MELQVVALMMVIVSLELPAILTMAFVIGRSRNLLLGNTQFPRMEEGIP